MTYYYKFTDTAKEMMRTTSFLPDVYRFITHDNFIIARTTPLDLSKNGTFKWLGLTLRKNMVVEFTDPITVTNSLFEVIGDEGISRIINSISDRLRATSAETIVYRSATYRITNPVLVEEITSEPDFIAESDSDFYRGPLQRITRTFISHLDDQIRHRYSLVDLFADNEKTTIIDSTLPKQLINTRYRPETLLQIRRNESSYKKLAAISPYTSNTYDIPRVPVEDLLGMLGYSLPTVQNLLEKVKQRRIHFIFVGTGGTGINTIFWLSELLSLFSIHHLFSCVTYVDEDSLEVSNLLRFPVDTSKIYLDSTYKADLANRIASRGLTYYSNIKRIRLLPDCSLTDSSIYYNEDIYQVTKDSVKYKTANTSTRLTIAYGAPDLVTRDRLSKIGNFICATHADNSCSMWLNPSQDLDIQMETYGKIELNTFFMNQLKMTLTLLEILADDTIDYLEQNKHLLEYSFSKNLEEASTDIQNKYHIL